MGRGSIVALCVALGACATRSRGSAPPSTPPSQGTPAEPVVFVEAPTDPSATRAPTVSEEQPAASVPAAKPEATEQEREQARQLFVAGQRCYEQGDYACALDHFRQAHAIVPMPALTYNVAHCLERLGLDQDACVEYRRLRDDPGGDLHDVAIEAIKRLGC